MTAIRRLLVAAVALPLALLAPTSAGAGTPSATTFHGVFTSRVGANCTPALPGGAVSGTWNIIKRGRSDATLSINIFVGGKHHVSFGGPIPQASGGGSIVLGPVKTLAGDLTISLKDGVLTYKIPDYSLADLTCESVTYTGYSSTDTR